MSFSVAFDGRNRLRPGPEQRLQPIQRLRHSRFHRALRDAQHVGHFLKTQPLVVPERDDFPIRLWQSQNRPAHRLGPLQLLRGFRRPGPLGHPFQGRLAFPSRCVLAPSRPRGFPPPIPPTKLVPHRFNAIRHSQVENRAAGSNSRRWVNTRANASCATSSARCTSPRRIQPTDGFLPAPDELGERLGVVVHLHPPHGLFVLFHRQGGSRRIDPPSRGGHGVVPRADAARVRKVRDFFPEQPKVVRWHGRKRRGAPIGWWEDQFRSTGLPVQHRAAINGEPRPLHGPRIVSRELRLPPDRGPGD